MYNKEKFPYHENPYRLHIGTAEKHAYFVPFCEGDELSFKAGDRIKSSAYEFLNGEWGFTYYESLEEVPEDFLELKSKDKIMVPSCWQMTKLLGDAPYGKPQYVNTRYPIPFDPPYVPDENPCGIYSKEIEYKKDGKSVFLVFEGVDSAFYLYLNGEFVGYSQVSHGISEFDITEKIIDGKNEVKVVVLKYCDGTYLEDQDKWRLSGIFREVYLLRRSKGGIRDLRITAKPSPDFSKAVVNVSVKVFGEFDGRFKASLMDAGERVIAEGTLLDNEFEIENPILWNAEKPYLYKLMLSCGGEVILENVGIREIYTDNGIFYFNGQPIKFLGVNRHESYPDSGATVSFEKMVKDLTLMKELNVNSIRTSHYPDVPEFYRLCDEMGFYVIDEADLESHGSADAFNFLEAEYDYKRIAKMAMNPDYELAILDREQLLVTRDINRPSVVIWSLGNESGYSDALRSAADWIKNFDDTRLVHYESSRYILDGKTEDELDLVSYMYPEVEFVKNYPENDDTAKNRPLILCEYCHAMGNGPGDLYDYVEAFYDNSYCMGGLIWEWADHGIEMGKTVEGKPVYYYGGDFGELVNDGNFCMDGLLLPDRTLTTSAREMKEVYGPLKIELKENKVCFTNRYGFTDITEDEFELSYLVCDKGEVKKSGKYPLNIKAFEVKEVALSELEGADIKGEKVTIDFSLSKADRIILNRQLIICEEKRKEKLIDSEVKFAEERNLVKVTFNNGKNEALISKKNGMLLSLKKNEKEFLKKELEIVLQRAFTDNDAQMKEDWKKCGLEDLTIKLYDIAVCEEKKEIVVKLSLTTPVYMPVVRLELKYTFGEKLRLGFDCEVYEKLKYLPRFGVAFSLASSMKAVKYVGYGPFESYVDKHHLSKYGCFECEVEELYTEYLKPQENGSHFGCSEVSVGKAEKVKITSNENFSFNYSQYTVKELSEKKHNFELTKADYNTLIVDYKMSGVGSSSCGPMLPEIYRLSEKKFTFDFFVEI